MEKIPDLGENYWTSRYKSGQTGWDTGSITTPLKTYFDQLTNKDLKILIPGCGNAHEAQYLWEQGFTNVYLVDIAQPPLQRFQEKCKDFPADHMLHQDFFTLEGPFELIIEQTFFCALNPAKRQDYVKQMHALLKPDGKLVGVLFDDDLFQDHPPFGGHLPDYKPLFEKYFTIEVMEPCYNSIKPREGRELFIKVRKDAAAK